MMRIRDRRPRVVMCVVGIVFLLVVSESCSTVPPRSRRVDAIVALYVPRVRLGEPAIAVERVLPNIGDRTTSDDAAPRADAIGGYSLHAFEFSSTFAGSVRELLGGFGGHTLGSLRQIQLTSTDSAAAAHAIARISDAFGQRPEEGCASWPGMGSDRVLYWRADDRGGIALTLPAPMTRFERANRQWVSQLLLMAGRLRRREIEVGFEDHVCPSLVTEPKNRPG
jgi:hypothetical protein